MPLWFRDSLAGQKEFITTVMSCFEKMPKLVEWVECDGYSGAKHTSPSVSLW